MISKNLYVLTPVEQQELSLVDTTLSQAWQIYERNINLLDDFYQERIAHKHHIGCPHCVDGFDCGRISCKWLAVRTSDEDGDFACCKQTFGGVRLDECPVSYGADYEYLGWGSQYPPENTETFLLGHIEWAQRLVDGEMPVTEGEQC